MTRYTEGILRELTTRHPDPAAAFAAALREAVPSGLRMCPDCGEEGCGLPACGVCGRGHCSCGDTLIERNGA